MLKIMLQVVKNLAKFFISLSVINWLHQDQLWATDEAYASLTRC